MDAFRASSGNNEYTRLVFNKKCITIQLKDDICHSITIIYWEFLTAETIQGGKYSRAESIQGQKVFMEVQYKQYLNTYIISQG